jgi:YVTN family beta-propeller protein
MISYFIKRIVFVFVGLAALYSFVPCNHSYAATHAYLSNSYDNTVSVIHTSDNTVTTTVDVGEWPYGVAVSPDGEYIYIANGGDDTVTVIRTSDNTVTASITVGSSPGGIAVSPDLCIE